MKAAKDVNFIILMLRALALKTIGLITHSFGRFRQELLRWVGNDTHIAMLIVSAGPLRVFAAHRVVT